MPIRAPICRPCRCSAEARTGGRSRSSRRRTSRSSPRWAGGLPKPFKAKAADGQTDLYGLIWRPTNFDPRKKYPVIENIYTGPQAAYVPKTFAAYRHQQQAIAELGFITVFVDGRGTALRSLAFRAPTYYNLGPGLRRRRSHCRLQTDGREVSVHGPGTRRRLGTLRGRLRFDARHPHAPGVLQGGRLVGRLSRQPHGQVHVERAVDGMARGQALRGAVQLHARADACRANCSLRMATSTRMSPCPPRSSSWTRWCAPTRTSIS